MLEHLFHLREHGSNARTEILGGATTFVTMAYIAVAPYMGENAFIAFGLAALGITWQERLGAVFVSGVLFLLITVLGLRAWLAESISTSLKHSFAVGIGLFLSLIGL